MVQKQGAYRDVLQLVSSYVFKARTSQCQPDILEQATSHHPYIAISIDVYIFLCRGQ